MEKERDEKGQFIEQPPKPENIIIEEIDKRKSPCKGCLSSDQCKKDLSNQTEIIYDIETRNCIIDEVN
jgi:hypothetical protein